MAGCRPSSRIFSRIFLLIFIIYLIFCIQPTAQNARSKRQISTGQPTIVTQNGHLIFQTGANHNITFRSSDGGAINIDGDNLKTIAQTVKNNKQNIQTIQANLNTAPADISSQLSALQRRFAELQTAGTEHLASLTGRLTTLEGQISGTSQTNRINRQVQRLTRRVSVLRMKVRRLNQLLTTDECATNPCQNGGTCVDRYNGYFCQCPSAWKGVTCAEDVNECYEYQGTDLGCQNGATCVNTPGSFRCTCQTNFYGTRCSESHDDCTGASPEALCSHGTCVNVARSQAGQAKYMCICNEGWTTDGQTPACNVDVNECTTRTQHCSMDPLVQCINVPGTFFCGRCPTGYSGNGFTCSDINECLVNNGGCSIAPRVDCINTRGSRRCGPCPDAYQGDGVTCSYTGICGNNNGGCHPRAQCLENVGIAAGYRVCRCPTGFVGNGVGLSGCVRGSGETSHACDNNPCSPNGECVATATSYICQCRPGYTGPSCGSNINECSSQPCQNGGTCSDGLNTYSCTCPPTHTGDQCQTARDICGGYLNGDSGHFAYPMQPGQQYQHSQTCAWIITVTTGKVIRIIFTRFNLENTSRNCNYDFLQFNDGSSASAHAIGKFCGHTPPLNGTLVSTHNQLYLWFRSDSSYSGEGFEFTWMAINPECGGDIRGSNHGAINSPGYPGQYPHGRDCVWNIFVDPGRQIQFTFAMLALEHHSNCSFDYLEIRDGVLDNDAIMQRYCSTETPAPITVSGPSAQVRFHSDSSLADRGFHITYSAVSAGRQCGGIFNQSNGILISPNYPNRYDHNGECVWRITVPHEGESVSLLFTDLDLEQQRNCSYDYVEIRDGPAEDSALISRYCGQDIPAIITTSGNSMWVKFVSDRSVRRRGFRAEWNVACGGTFTAEEGILLSPNYPDPYPHVRQCMYLINQAEDQVITVTFLEFDVEAPHNGDCVYDYLTVYDSSTAAPAQELGRFCGTQLPGPLVSTGNRMFLKFVTDSNMSGRGFRIRYTTNVAGCGGTLMGTNGQFTSPSHPTTYPNGANCTWFISTDPGLIIRLTFHVFNLEKHSLCRYDYVEVFDNSTSTYLGNSLGKFCGAVLPPVLTSSDNTMSVAFITDSSIGHEGFSATYIGLNASTFCGMEIRESFGEITSPNYPARYPNGRVCVWTIVVQAGNQIRLNITNFILEHSRTCQYDVLEIRNGGYSGSPLIGRYCGTTVDNIITSHSNRLYLRFKTDQSATRSGFRLTYDTTLTGCGGDMTGRAGTFTSPNYPMVYHHAAQCFWTIRVAQGSRLSLLFTDIDTESHSRCLYDYVEVRDGGAEGRVLGKFCGQAHPPPIESQQNTLWIKFSSDTYVSGRGFSASYAGICRNTLTSRSGVIESPSFPTRYPNNRECQWVIRTALGSKVNVSFSHFNLEPAQNCADDYIIFRDGDDENADALQTFCGPEIPPDVHSSSNSLFIKFVSNARTALTGFRLEYITDGCGGTLRDQSGSFTSPNYPSSYPSRTDCQWLINVNYGSAIELIVHDIDLEEHPSCGFDSLEVFNGLDATSPRLTQICQSQTTAQTLKGTSNFMFVRFHSDVSLAGRGFRVTYRAVTGGCGGNFTTPSGTITSMNYPQSYAINTECEWMITVTTGRIIQLTVEDFDVEGSSTCHYDYVAFYDGSNVNATELMKHCGRTMPDPAVVTTTDNQMFIRFRSDGSVVSRGFKASYITGCGGEEDADVGGVITSPSYPQPYPTLSNCTWVIRSSDNNNRVTLTFTHIDLDHVQSDGCHDYVTVYGGDSDLSPEIGTYCGSMTPAAITSHGPSLTVKFISDRSRPLTGFRATYTSSSGACSADFTGLSGAFNSPGYPESYPLNTECVWTVSASPGNRVQLSFSLFNINSDGVCNMDYVEIREGNVNGRYVGRYCGNTIPSNITALRGLWVKFRSDSQTPGIGFMAQYNAVHGGEVNGTSGQIASPNYPRRYLANMNYVWTITVPEYRRIRVQFVTMNLEQSPGCTFDFVKLFNGGSDTSPLMHTFCGTDLPIERIISLTNQMRVQFYSDRSGQGTGFLFNWSATRERPRFTTTPGPSTTPLPGCRGSLSASDTVQLFTSPGYPYGYAHGLNCQWTIESEAGNRVWLNITNFNLERHSSCQYDSVKVLDRIRSYHGQRYRILGTFCGGRANAQPLISAGNTMVVRFKTDGSVNRTGFEAAYKSVCGGFIVGEHSGVIQSTNYPSNYQNNVNCTWMISVVRGRTISLMFTNFNLYGESTNCNNDYLMLLNGGDINSPPLGTESRGRVCGSSVPVVNETSDNQLYISFISDRSNSASGFRLEWSEVQVACGGLHIMTSQYYVTSPNYPNDYPHNVQCEWIIMAPATERIRVDFEDQFSIETGRSTCRNDYVMLRDGGTMNAPQLGRYCGSTKPSTVLTTSNVLYIKFRSDNSVPRPGFKAKVQIATCGGSYFGSHGVIASPNYPSNYEANSNCEWIISAPTGHFITFTFAALNLESSVNCTKDFIEIRELNSTGTQLIQRCGSTLPDPVQTSDSFAYVRFVSDGSDNAAGFSFSFTASVESCGGSLTTPSGTITSPNFPGQYPHSRLCTWNIEVPLGRRVTLTFDIFSIEDANACRFDSVQIYNGIMSSSPRIAQYCGNTLPTGVTETSGNAMKIIFGTDGSVSNGGFRAHYTSNNEAYCGGLLTASPGNITSLYYGSGNYSNNQQCIWQLENPSRTGGSVAIKFNAFDLEGGHECTYDFLEFREGVDERGDLIGRFCGNMSSLMPFISPSPSVWVMFQTDLSFVNTGFDVQYKFTGCGGIMTENYGALTSPSYPRNYAPNSQCAWKIQAPEGSQIILTPVHFETEDHPDCVTDYVEIFNGGDFDAPSIGKFCGNTGPVEFRSGSNMLRVVFIADGTGTAQGFKLEYTFATEGCGGLYHADSGVISSPGYPGSYPHNEQCEWVINVQTGYHVQLTFIPPFDMEYTPDDCRYDYVEVFDVFANSSRTSLGRYCHRVTPPVLNSSNHIMVVRFRSDLSTNGNGFSTNWTTSCGASYNTDTGVLISPGFPNNYGSNLNCNYTISVDEGKYIVLTFDADSFDLEGGRRGCNYDYVSLHRGTSRRSRRLGRFCGNTVPPPITSNNDLFLNFVTDRSHERSGYRATWTVEQCGGNFTDATGVISSPLHPSRYFHNMNCTFLITVQANHIVELKFNTFDLESGGRRCHYDRVELFDGPLLSSRSLGRMCGTAIPEKTITTSNIMLVHFKTDHSYAGRGFTATYRTTIGPQQGCGGFLNGTSGSFRSPDLDHNGQYDPDLNCRWLITVPQNQVVRLSIPRIGITAPPCTFDYIKIWDGFAMVDNKLVSTLCGIRTEPYSFTALSNNIYVQFYSDNIDSGSGFNATFTSVPAICGGVYNATMAVQTLSSPSYPNAYGEHVSCRWFIRTSYPKRISLKVQAINIPGPSDCSQNYLKFLDHPMRRRGRQLVSCGTVTQQFDSQSVTLMIIYRSAAVLQGQGVIFTYQISNCNQSLTGSSGQFRSPGWPSVYRHRLNCNISIVTPPGTYVALYFQVFTIERHSSCRFDHLRVHNGSDSSAPVITTLCGAALPSPIFASGNSLFLNFKTDGSVAYAGFDIAYTSSNIPLGCGGNMTALSGVLTSPGYPDNYTDAQTCDWFVKFQSQRAINITFTSFEILSPFNCASDYLRIYSWPSNQLVRTYCGSSQPAVIALNSNGFHMRFYSDGTGASLLYKFTYIS